MSKLINLEYLTSLNPGKDLLDNFKKHYPSFEGTWNEFLDLSEVSYKDKIYLARKYLSKNQIIHFGILSVESIKHIYNQQNPEDTRLTDFMNYLKQIKDYTKLTDEQKAKIEEWSNKIMMDVNLSVNYLCGALTHYFDSSSGYMISASNHIITYYAENFCNYYYPKNVEIFLNARKIQESKNIIFLKIVGEME